MNYSATSGNCRAKALSSPDHETLQYDEPGYEIHNHGPEHSKREAERVISEQLGKVNYMHLCLNLR